MELEITLKKVAKILQKLKIPYLVTGGVAIVVWGRPRYTADIDIIIELKKNKIKKILAALILEGYIDENAVKEALKHKSEFNFIDNETSMKVDFWILQDSDFDKSRLKRAVEREIFGQKVTFSSPEDLILKKLLWFKESKSTRQLEDIYSVIAIIKDKLDYNYLRKWAKKQNTLGVLEEQIELVTR
ncbi:MAG: nucleotidyltransferase [Patescibacteria group bacterium]